MTKVFYKPEMLDSVQELFYVSITCDKRSNELIYLGLMCGNQWFLIGYGGASHVHTNMPVGCPMIAYYDTMLGDQIYDSYSTPAYVSSNGSEFCDVS